MKDDNKEKKPLFYRLPAKMFLAFDSNINNRKLNKKIKQFYLFIFTLIVVISCFIGIRVAPDITVTVILIIIVTVVLWAMASEVFL